MQNQQKKSFKETVVQWNIKYPLDRWWRQKHSIPYGSVQHLDMCQFDILFEFAEDTLYKDLQKEKPEEVKYRPGYGDWLHTQPRFSAITDKEKSQIDDILSLDDLDLDGDSIILK